MECSRRSRDNDVMIDVISDVIARGRGVRGGGLSPPLGN